MCKELPVAHHDEMVQGYEIALAANAVYDLRAQKAVESAKAIAELLSRNPDPMQDSVTEALSEAAKARDAYTAIFDGLMESASALIPARHIFDDSEVAFSTTTRYSGPPWL